MPSPSDTPDTEGAYALELAHARKFIAARFGDVRFIQLALVGSHYYGFPSADSDLDLKGVHLAPTSSFLGIKSFKETHDRIEFYEDIECDITTHEVVMALRLLLKGNGNVLERFCSPLQVIDYAEATQLQKLALGAVGKHFAGHYRGFFNGKCKEFRNASEPSVKSLLYACRVALTGIHLLRTGDVVGDVAVLGPRYGLDTIRGLVEQKKSGTEKCRMTTSQAREQDSLLDTLALEIDAAIEESKLPEGCENIDTIDRWLVNLRCSNTT